MSAALKIQEVHRTITVALAAQIMGRTDNAVRMLIKKGKLIPRGGDGKVMLDLNEVYSFMRTPKLR